MRDHHFIIKYSEKTKLWEFDTDSEEARFPDGTIFNNKSKKWEHGYTGRGKFVLNEEQLAEKVTAMIKDLNTPESDEPFGPPDEDDRERAETCECSMSDRVKATFIHHGGFDEIMEYCTTCGGMIE